MVGRKVIFSALVPLTMLMSSCGKSADLKAIQEFASLANQASEGFPKIANDIYLSCIRGARYEEPIEVRSEAEEQCDKESREVGPMLIESHDVLIAYITTLGKVAGNDIGNFASDVTPLAAAVGKIPGVQQVHADAGAKIVEILLRVTTDRSRRVKLKEVIVATDDDLQTFVDGFTLAVQRGYLNIFLKAEEQQIDSYYGNYISRIQGTIREANTSRDLTETERATNRANLQSATRLLLDLDSQWNQARDVVRAKRIVADEYLVTLNKIAEDHHKIKMKYEKGMQPSDKELRTMLEDNTKALKSFVKDVNNTFNK